ncbi:TPA: HNH endonuclease [Proteus mirabilis]|nr:HNH endonuclease [Proteus mirabilis]HEK2723865.1 HNH endonuclease [Proteus mirabilis]
MAINQKDIKLLWGRSGNRCAICRVELTQNKNATTSAFTLGEQAHIVGEKVGAARGKSTLTLEARNSYHNLILLCPNHHTEIDNNEEDWPVEKLHIVKSEHELWVTESLSSVTDQFAMAKKISVTAIIDMAVSHCSLGNWKNWTSFALSPDPRWQKKLPEQIFEFRQKVISAIWPDEFNELKRATETLSITLHIAAQQFMEHTILIGDTYHPDKFYKANGWNDNYDIALSKYTKWVSSCHEKLIEATKAANWFADIVRRDINPTFFAEKGKFLTMEGDILGFEAKLHEYTDEQKASLPN